MEIKFRKKDLVKTMRRIDTVYAKLVEQLGKEREFGVVDIGGGKLKHEAQAIWWQPPVSWENSFCLFCWWS